MGVWAYSLQYIHTQLDLWNPRHAGIPLYSPWWWLVQHRYTLWQNSCSSVSLKFKNTMSNHKDCILLVFIYQELIFNILVNIHKMYSFHWLFYIIWTSEYEKEWNFCKFYKNMLQEMTYTSKYNFSLSDYQFKMALRTVNSTTNMHIDTKWWNIKYDAISSKFLYRVASYIISPKTIAETYHIAILITKTLII